MHAAKTLTQTAYWVCISPHPLGILFLLYHRTCKFSLFFTYFDNLFRIYRKRSRTIINFKISYTKRMTSEITDIILLIIYLKSVFILILISSRKQPSGFRIFARTGPDFQAKSSLDSAELEHTTWRHLILFKSCFHCCLFLFQQVSRTVITPYLISPSRFFAVQI